MKQPIMLKFWNNDGYTLLELIIAVVVLVVLIMVAIPLYHDTIDTTKITADEANLVILNKATQELKIKLGEKSLPFDKFEECTEALDYLVREGFLQSAPKPSSTAKCFVWNRNEQKWEMGSVHVWDRGEHQPSKE